MSSFPFAYAQKRDWAILSAPLIHFSTLQENWVKSSKILDRLRTQFSLQEQSPEILTIAAAGSLGRMEACDASDADLIIVLNDETVKERRAELYESIWAQVDSLDIKRPKSNGVFGDPATESELWGKDVADPGESLKIFGKRLLLLLESQPLYCDRRYETLIDNIVKRYAAYIEKDPIKEWTFLLNDLIRYFRSICVTYQNDFERDNEKWPLRNIKLRHSRLVMYAGLLVLLGESSKQGTEKVFWLRERLSMTPLERLAWVYERNNDSSFSLLAGLYDNFLGHLSDPLIRKAINVDYQDRYSNRYYTGLKANSDRLVAELLRMVLSRRSDWTPRFFEYLLF